MTSLKMTQQMVVNEIFDANEDQNRILLEQKKASNDDGNMNDEDMFQD